MDYEQQQRSWLKVYGPYFINEEELLSGAAAARHGIPAVSGMVPVSLGSFLQVIDVAK